MGELIVAIITEWGPVGTLAGMLFYLFVSQRNQHINSIKMITESHSKSMRSLVEAVEKQTSTLSDLHSIIKSVDTEEHEQTRAMYEHYGKTDSDHAKIITLLEK